MQHYQIHQEKIKYFHVLIGTIFLLTINMCDRGRTITHLQISRFHTQVWYNSLKSITQMIPLLSKRVKREVCVKIFSDSQRSAAAPLNFGNWLIVSTYVLYWMWFLIHLGLTLIHVKWAPGALDQIWTITNGTKKLVPVSISDKLSYRKITWCPQAAKLVVWIIALLWNMTGVSAALLLMSLSNFRFTFVNTNLVVSRLPRNLL